jgi:sarcosine oxidase subunit gamma
MAEVANLPDAPNISLVQRPAAMVNLRGPGDDTGFVTRAGGIIGLPLPTAPNRFVGAGGRQCVWQGPDEWLVIDTAEPADGLCDRLDDALADWHHAVTDVSGNRVALRLCGPAATAVLAVGCPLDLDPRRFTAGMAVQTVLARTTVTLMKIDDAPNFDILVRRSLARYVQAWLVNAAANGLL